ncbi:helix-turn-helix domain-containing protein [Streptomyces californicus]|uniref:Helix-turn-helix domain-containing protein n=1 Tax=Streptomyces californicus TaxID=67351 RepID=A0ABD7CTT0_9ACTN|nr:MULTISPECIES: helix-turn-helix transcriptional regulator [Streptomyces]QRV30829.1 helix-turn-helix domain-containing protein [Streptomyces californicus]QRV33562.1 helix-turn-helix domain-containing protein [Streptomyces californicus]QRV44244.1 helix-turn-helix domain-containing protein [Streptomyces californicus]QRV50933.1 helix-turn-helix domain-containing protein [Streptomyces californicus]
MTHGTDGIGTIGQGASKGSGARGRAASEPESQYSLKVFGEVVKAFRKRARLTQEEFAPLVRYSVETIASIEQGRRFPPPDFVERAEAVLDAFGVIEAAAKHLTRKRGLASWFQQWAQLELSALSLHTYECRMIPGLLQTPAYARTLFTDQLPPLTDEQIEVQLAARQERQQLLRNRPNTAFSFILEEHLFLRNLGGDEVTSEQLDHLLELSELRNVTIQIMDVVRPHHSGLGGPMQLLETPQHQWFGYLEGQKYGQLVTDPKAISTYQMRCASMRSQARTAEDSRSLMQRMRGAT